MNRHFVACTAPVCAGDAADKGFIDFDCAQQKLAFGHDWTAPELVHPDPGRLIGLQTQDTLQPESGNLGFLRGHEPDRGKPGAHGGAGAAEDRARSHRRGPGATDAHPQALARAPRVHAVTFRT